MKKILAALIFAIVLTLPAFCAEFLPKYKSSITDYGIGIYFGDGKATVYAEPDDKSNVVAKLSWDTEKVKINGEETIPKNVFGVFLPENALSGFIALDELGTEYTKIVYDTAKGLSGWIKNAPDNKVFYWRQLFYKYGKTRGLYIFADINKDDRVLHLAPEEDAEVSYTFIYPKYIRLQLIKGNWALLKVVDYDNEQKVGWFKWRNPDGTLNLFPLFNGF
ncbi:MAG: hypothetical protein K6A44_03470 [bacterium]|nr:hypothetical protein [bacterium]